MADQYGLFWNSVSGDRKYDADSFAEWLGKFFTTGVFNGELQVTPTSGMVVNVGSGYANINGKVRFFDTDTSITLAPASGVYPRIDTIVVRADYTNREITLEYITGAYSGNDPQPTAPTRNASMHEIVLAQILVSAGSTEVTAGDITDTRANSEICGWVTGTVDHVAVSQLTEQAQAQFEAWFDHMKGQLSEDAAGNLQLQIDDINDGIGDTDISAIGDGTLTGAVDSINKSLTALDSSFDDAVTNINRQLTVHKLVVPINRSLDAFATIDVPTSLVIPADFDSHYFFSQHYTGNPRVLVTNYFRAANGTLTLSICNASNGSRSVDFVFVKYMIIDRAA